MYIIKKKKKKKETYNTKKYYAHLGEVKRTKIMKGTSFRKKKKINKCLLKRMSE